MSIKRTYRHRQTGVVREYPDSLARVFTDLEEVDTDAPCVTCQPDQTEVDYLAEPSEDPTEDPNEEPAGSADDKEE